MAMLSRFRKCRIIRRIDYSIYKIFSICVFENWNGDCISYFFQRLPELAEITDVWSKHGLTSPWSPQEEQTTNQSPQRIPSREGGGLWLTVQRQDCSLNAHNPFLLDHGSQTGKRTKSLWVFGKRGTKKATWNRVTMEGKGERERERRSKDRKREELSEGKREKREKNGREEER